MDLPVGVVSIPSETPLEETALSFGSGHQLEIASELEMGTVSTSGLSFGVLSGLDLRRPCTCCQSLRSYGRQSCCVAKALFSWCLPSSVPTGS